MKYLLIAIFNLCCITIGIADSASYWLIKLNQEVIYDSREIEDFSFWDYHQLDIDSLKRTDTIKIYRHRCSVYPGAIEEFYVVDDHSGKIEKEIKYIGNPRLTITTKELFKGLDEVDEINIFHFSEGIVKEPRKILKVTRKR